MKIKFDDCVAYMCVEPRDPSYPSFWIFYSNLGPFFGGMDSYSIMLEMEKRGLLEDGNDSGTTPDVMRLEFSSQRKARAFLRKLNEQPELRGK